MAEDSPCRRTPSTMPSSVHSMGGSVQDSDGRRSYLAIVIPGRAKHEPGIHNHDLGYGFRACAKRRIHDVQLHIGE